MVSRDIILVTASVLLSVFVLGIALPVLVDKPVFLLAGGTPTPTPTPGPGTKSILYETGSVLDDNKQPIVGASVYVGLFTKDGCPNDNDQSKLWSQYFNGVTDARGRFDVQLGTDANPLYLELNKVYFKQVKVKAPSDTEFVITDLNPASPTSCMAPLLSPFGPGENEVSTTQILDESITSDDLGDEAVTKGKIGEKAVEGWNIADAAITKDKIAKEAVDNTKLQNNSVTAEKINVKSVYSTAIQSGAIVDDRVSPSADIRWTKISSDAPWYDGVCEVQVSADLEDWFSEGTYVGGVSKYFYAKAASGDIYKFEERPTVSPVSPTTIYKDDVAYSTGGVTKYKKVVEKPNLENCWADRGIAPYCNTLYSTNTACMQAGSGRCTSFEGEFEECVTAPKYWAEYAPVSCTSVTYGQTYFKYLRVYCH